MDILGGWGCHMTPGGYMLSESYDAPATVGVLMLQCELRVEMRTLLPQVVEVKAHLCSQ